MMHEFAEPMTHVPFAVQDVKYELKDSKPVGRPAEDRATRKTRLAALDAQKLKQKALRALARGYVLAEVRDPLPEMFSPRWALTADASAVLDTILGGGCIDAIAMDVCLEAQLYTTCPDRFERLPGSLLEASDHWPAFAMTTGKPKICALFTDDHFVLIAFEYPARAVAAAKKKAKGKKSEVALPAGSVSLAKGVGLRPVPPADEMHLSIRIWDSYPAFRGGRGVKRALPRLLEFINSRWVTVTSVSWDHQECPAQNGADCGPCTLSNSAALVGYDPEVVWDRITIKRVCEEIQHRYVKIQRGHRAEVEAEAAADAAEESEETPSGSDDDDVHAAP
jgi:hypothetical protein